MGKNKIYPRSNDNQTVYLKSVVTCPTIEVGDFTVYNDFVNDPRDFEKNNVIMAGVRIGDGAIIGTRAVVTKDVEPYSIVGGVPAKEIRKRFAPDVIKRLLELQWWNWPDDKIRNVIKAIHSDNMDMLEHQ